MEYKGFIYAPTPKTAWDNLSMQEKSEMMKVAVRNGITDLKTIREKYNEFAEGGNLSENNLSETNQFGGGGYVPSRAIRQRIANWEGAAMDRDTIDPLSGKVAKKNRSFEEVATSFVNAIPKDIRGQVLGNQELADNLYSYAYNVGPGKFRERVIPALRRYYQGNGSVSEVTDSMWASGDKKLKGLRRRRTEERSGVSRALQGSNAASPVSYSSQTGSNGFVPFKPMLPEVFKEPHPVVPYGIADTPKESQEVAVSPYDIKVLEGQRRRDNLQHFMNVLNMVYGDNAEDEGSFFLPFGTLGYNNTFNDGGKIHIKPENRGKFTALKERTGHSATWFKEHGTPAQKKMAIFALNSRYWKHDLGGNLFDDGGNLFVKYVDSYRVNPETGGVYDKTGEVKEGAVILPEVEVVGRPLGNYAIQREAERMRGIQSNQGLSGVDPIGQFAVETAALNPVFKLAGTAGLYGLGRYGESLTGFARPQNWARGKLIAREMDRSPFGGIGGPVLSPQVRTKVDDFAENTPAAEWTEGSQFSIKNSMIPNGTSEDIKPAIERGRNTLIGWLESSFYKNRLKDEPLYRVADDVVSDASAMVRGVPIAIKERSLLEDFANGVTSPRPFTKKVLPDGTIIRDFNTGLDVAVASDLGENADDVTLHELLHYMTSNSKGTPISKAGEKIIEHGWFAPTDTYYNAIGVINRTRGKGWQNYVMDQNNALLPKYDTVVKMVMEEPNEAKALLIRTGRTAEQAEAAVNSLRERYSYWYDIQEQRAHLQELFLSKIKPHLKNPNDVAEIETFLTEHPEVLENSSPYKYIQEVRPGSLKEYAGYFASALGTVPFILNPQNNERERTTRD